MKRADSPASALPPREPATPPFQPSAGRRLVAARLAAALRPDAPTVAKQVGELGAEPDVVSVAVEHRVDGLLAHELTRAGMIDRLPRPLRDGLRDATFARHAAWSALRAARDAAFDALAEASVPVIALKGAALASIAYPKPELRPMNDIDLLVPEGRAPDAAAALERAGFRGPPGDGSAIWREVYFHVPFRAPGPEGVMVELHWRIAQPDRHPIATDELFAYGRDADLGGRSGQVLGAEDLIIHQALHHAYHYFQPTVIWLHDQALLHLDPPPLERLLARARRFHAVTPLLLSVAMLEKAYPGLVRPAFAIQTRRSRRVRWMLRAFGSSDPITLFAKREQRRRQLALGLLMLDRPGQLLRGLWGWLARSARHGDRAGHRQSLAPPRGPEN